MSEWCGMASRIDAYVFGALIGLTVGIVVGWVCHELQANGFWMYTYVHTDHSQQGDNQGPL